MLDVHVLQTREIYMWFVDKDESARRSELVAPCYLLCCLDIALSVRRRSLS